jgi:sterol desaturase/sphingolipid hydroxylase (fatty acid hydroxylase superfamily)
VQDLVETLNVLPPLLLIGGLTLFLTLETVFPYFEHGAGRRTQRWRNVGMIAIAAAMNAAIGSFGVLPIAWSEANSFGLLYQVTGHSLLTIVVGVFLVDLCSYALHVTMHKVPALWRIHRVHHADTELDASRAVRLHPFELLYLLGMLAVALSLLGVPVVSYLIYTAIALPWFLLNHSNIKYPAWFERRGSWLMSTPNWHRVHHSSLRPETDSHHGCVFSIWDRVFGTTRKTHVESIRFGLERYREPGDQTVWALLRMPFGPL